MGGGGEEDMGEGEMGTGEGRRHLALLRDLGTAMTMVRKYYFYAFTAGVLDLRSGRAELVLDA